MNTELQSQMLPMHTELPATPTHRLVRRLVTVTFWGAETPSLMSLPLARLMTIFFQPQDSASFATHSAVFMPIFKFAIKFQWFKCELISIKKFG